MMFPLVTRALNAAAAAASYVPGSLNYLFLPYKLMVPCACTASG